MVAPFKNANAHRSNAGKSYGLMVLLALVAAILGVMVLHKLREGRLFSALVKEKDHDLISLHLLLQKERKFSEEAKKKLEEMETNMHSLSAQRSDVEGRLSEVNSLVSSLKDEMKTLESQLEEKQSEINTLKQQQMTANASDDPSTPPNNSTISGDEGVYMDKSGTQSPNENESIALEDSVEEAKSSSKSGMNPSNGNEDEASTEKLTTDDKGNGEASVIRVKSKHRRLKRRRYKDLITRLTEGKNGHLQQNEVGSSTKKTNTEEAVEQTGQNTGMYMKKDEYVAFKTGEPQNMAEMKEGKDSSVEANKDVDNETGHFEDKEETKSNKDEEQKPN